MNSIDISVYYSAARAEAMERILKEQGKSLESAVRDKLDELYGEIVPLRERTSIEEQIQLEEAQAAENAKAARRFGVYHIREQGGDSYFYSEVHKNFYLAACECRQYLQDGKQFLLSDYFKHKQSLGYPDYTDFTFNMGYVPQITMLVEIDADKGMCMVQKAGEDDSWHQYKLKDLSTGIYHAKRKDGLSFAQRDKLFSEFIEGREIAIHVPAYSFQEQKGKPVAQRIEEFNASNAPFYITQYDRGDYGLSLRVSFLFPPYTNYGQKAFDAYAEQAGEAAKQGGVFARGNGHDWQYVFEKAFENNPLLEKIQFDCEAGGFYCRSTDLSVLEDLGSRFKEICESGQAFQNLVCKALEEADHRQQMEWSGM